MLNIKNSYLKRLCVVFVCIYSEVAIGGLFGYQENERKSLQMFPQWLSVLERHIKQGAPKGNCETSKLDQCHVKNWMKFLESIRHLSKARQIKEVNLYANKHDYILDIENYGLKDYWATPREFLYNNGDCEDYAITKMLSLKILGFNMSGIRLVVLQDTNLRIPHAVLALNTKNDILIMDNQVDEVISHKHVLHYVPIYALNDKKWWMFLPQ
ncbi:MAG: transglutaminase-like cysteine peptidase [Gammaproteobacteria bacterium]|nr:transglutaminase-like cysteine peptidase [Gammaproteobacteria bacterium]